MENQDSPNTPNEEGRSSLDDIIDLYKKDVDREELRENLKLSVEERFRKHDRRLKALRAEQRDKEMPW